MSSTSQPPPNRGTSASDEIVFLEGKVERLEAEVERLRNALRRIAAYGEAGICPYGCDTPYIARATLGGRAIEATEGKAALDALDRKDTP